MQKSPWLERIASIAGRIVEETRAETATDESNIILWLRRLVSEKASEVRAPIVLNPRIPGNSFRRQKVWLVPSGDDVVEQMMDLLADFGTLPPEPTAMFPCDSSTTSAAVSEMAWRLRRAAKTLDETGQVDVDDPLGKEIIEHRIQSIFLCRDIIVVTRPETLSPQDQEILLAGIGKMTAQADLIHVLDNTDIGGHDRAVCQVGTSSRNFVPYRCNLAPRQD